MNSVVLFGKACAWLCQLNVAQAKRGLVGLCSSRGRRILGNSGDVMPGSEASGELTAMTRSAVLLTVDCKMLGIGPKLDKKR